MKVLTFLLFLIIIGILGFGGYFVYDFFFTNDETSTTTKSKTPDNGNNDEDSDPPDNDTKDPGDKDNNDKNVKSTENEQVQWYASKTFDIILPLPLVFLTLQLIVLGRKAYWQWAAEIVVVLTSIVIGSFAIYKRSDRAISPKLTVAFAVIHLILYILGGITGTITSALYDHSKSSNEDITLDQFNGDTRVEYVGYNFAGLPGKLGVFHTSIRYGGKEYEFGKGIIVDEPLKNKQLEALGYRPPKVTYLGKVPKEKFIKAIRTIEPKYRPGMYHYTKRNCVHFAGDLVKEMGLKKPLMHKLHRFLPGLGSAYDIHKKAVFL